MAEYSITFARSARKELQSLEAATVRCVLAKIELLKADPRPIGCRKIRGAHSLWRIRVGDHRAIYSVDDERRTVDVAAVRHRRDAY